MVQVEGANATDGRGPSIFDTADSLAGHGGTGETPLFLQIH